MPCGGFGHLDAGEAGGDHTAMNDQKHAAADSAAANAAVEDFFHIVHGIGSFTAPLQLLLHIHLHHGFVQQGF